jgi:tetratricopeptide (TPR) repeat protein
MRATRIVLLIANGVRLPFFAYWGASRVYHVATYPTTHDLIFASVLLANIIPTVVASFTLAGNIAYIWRSRPHAAFRIVLLIANGVWLLLYAVGGPLQVYVLATHEYAVAEAIATHILCFSILAGNITYIWPSRPHAHNEKGANASHTRQPLMGMRKPWGRVDGAPVRIGGRMLRAPVPHLVCLLLSLFAGLLVAAQLGSLDKTRAQAYYNRGVAYRAEGDTDHAIADYNEAIRLDPDLAEAYSSRGIAYRAKGDTNRAIADYNEAIRLNPSFAEAYNNRAWAYFNAGKAAQGLPDAERSLQLLPNNAHLLDTRGHIFEALGRREEAIADFRRALSINPKLEASREALKRLGASPD